MKQKFSLIPLLFFMMLISSNVSARAFDSTYLVGNWEINTAGKCDAKNAESLLIRSDGSFTYGRSGKPESVGFWQIKNEAVSLNMLTSPAYFADINNKLKAFNGLYGHYVLNIISFDVEDKQFSAVAIIGDQTSRLTLQRCN